MKRNYFLLLLTVLTTFFSFGQENQGYITFDSRAQGHIDDRVINVLNEQSMDPSINIFSPASGQIFDANTTNIDIAYDILDFPDFDGLIIFSVKEDGDFIITDDVIASTNINLDVRSGRVYEVIVSLRDSFQNPYSPDITSTINFSVAAPAAEPSIVITSPTEGQVFDATKNNVTVNYEIKDFPGFTLGSDGSILYEVERNGVTILTQDDFAGSSFEVDLLPNSSYRITMELVDASRNSFSPVIKTTVNFSVASTTAEPSVVITSPTEGQVFDAGTTSVTFLYDVLNFPDFENGTVNGFVSYTLSKSGNPTTTSVIQPAGVQVSRAVSAGDYFAQVELLDSAKESFSPAIITSVNFSVSTATAEPSINIFSPTNGEVFDAGITSVDVSYDILNFPSFTPGADGFVVYTLNEDGAVVYTNNDTRDATISNSVSSGKSYQVIIELTDAGGNPFSPAIQSTIDFSVASTTAEPSVVITSPTEGQVFDASTTNVTFLYDVLNFPDFENGTISGFVSYTFSKSGNPTTTTAIQPAGVQVSRAVSAGDYFVQVELLDSAKESFSPAIITSVNFSVLATAEPSINIFSPEEGRIFDAGTTSVDVSYDILDFPSFTPGSDGFVVYTLKEDGEVTYTNNDIRDATISNLVSSGKSYEVTVELIDASGNRFSPEIKSTINFSVANSTVEPTLVITSPSEGRVFDAVKNKVTINYEIKDFPSFTLGTDGSITYEIVRNGDPVFIQDDFTGSSFDVDVSPDNNYTVMMELVDASRNPFSPAIKTFVNFSVLAATTEPSINIYAPSNGEVFETSTTNVDVSYDILNFPSFTSGSDGFVVYTLKEDGEVTYTNNDIRDATISNLVSSGKSYEVTIGLVDAGGNPFSPAIQSTINFSVAAPIAEPSVVITSPKQGGFLSPNTTQVIVDYEIKDFPGFIPGSNGFIRYQVWKNSDLVIAEDNLIDIFFDVTPGSYQVTVELLNDSREEFSPRILTSTSFFIEDSFRKVESLEVLGFSDRDAFYELTEAVTITYDTQNDRNQKYIQDATAGFLVDDENGILATNYNVGDAIIGLKGQYIEDAEGKKFIPVAEPTDIVSSGNTVPAKSFSLKELKDNIYKYQSQRVTVENVSFDIADGTVKFDSSITRDYTISSGGEKMNFRLEFDNSDLEGTIIPEGTFNITGIAAIPSTSTKSKKSVTGLPQIYGLQLNGIVAGVGENTIEGFTVYPNPVNKGTITLGTSSFDKKEISIFNILGEKVFTAKVFGTYNKITINELNSGVYILKVTESGRIATKKLIVK